MLTPDRRERRRGFVGSSDVPALLGKSPFANAADVYASKVFNVESQETGATRHGEQIEISVLQWAADELGVALDTDQFRIGPNKIIAASHDAIVNGKPEGVEAKTAAVFHWYPGVNDEWGEEGTDAVPSHVLLQCQAQCYVSELQLVWVPCLIGGRGFKMYRVERSDRLIAVIVKECERFWNENVLPRIPPIGLAPSLEVVRHLRREPETVATISSDLVRPWIMLKHMEKQVETLRKSHEAAMLSAIGDAEAGKCDLGQFTVKQQSRKAYSVEETTFTVVRPDKRLNDSIKQLQSTITAEQLLLTAQGV